MPDDNHIQGVTTEGDAQDPQGGAPAPETPPEPSPDQETPADPSGDAAEATPGEPEKTDRGTNKAKEPESQFYQQLKNENGDMRRLLSDPEALKGYLRRLEGTNAPEKGEEDDLADLSDKVLNEDGKVDVKKLVQYLDGRQMQKLERGIKGMSQDMERTRRLETAYNEDKAAVRQAYPELDPRNKEQFDPELEAIVADRFIAQGGLEGKVTLTQVVEGTFAYHNKLRGSAKQQAETEVVRRQAGAIPPTRTPSADAGSEENMTPEEILSSRVHKAISGGK